MARRRRRGRTVFEAASRASGRIRVVDYRAERRLIVNGEILSVYPLDGDWSRVRREYWWRALAVTALPRRPSVLLVGLGGGTQIHLLHSLTRPPGARARAPRRAARGARGQPPPPRRRARPGSGAPRALRGSPPPSCTARRRERADLRSAPAQAGLRRLYRRRWGRSASAPRRFLRSAS